jgi:hypothetical protein
MGTGTVAVTKRERKVADKLPYARRYLRAARWALDALLSEKPVGAAFFFYVIGLVATLRACQLLLINRDRKLSPRHEEVIGEWKRLTKDFNQIPELHFITTARNALLKDGRFPSYATRSEVSWEAGVVVDYETAHYLNGERRDLEIDVRATMDWFERQLAEIEAQLPTSYSDQLRRGGARRTRRLCGYRPHIYSAGDYCGHDNRARHRRRSSD